MDLQPKHQDSWPSLLGHAACLVRQDMPIGGIKNIELNLLQADKNKNTRTGIERECMPDLMAAAGSLSWEPKLPCPFTRGRRIVKGCASRTRAS